jgi:mannose/fructose/N-acetylgalactosamine-specific phosphotransferase system component IIB
LVVEGRLLHGQWIKVLEADALRFVKDDREDATICVQSPILNGLAAVDAGDDFADAC